MARKERRTQGVSRLQCAGTALHPLQPSLLAPHCTCVHSNHCRAWRRLVPFCRSWSLVEVLMRVLRSENTTTRARQSWLQGCEAGTGETNKAWARGQQACAVHRCCRCVTLCMHNPASKQSLSRSLRGLRAPYRPYAGRQRPAACPPWPGSCT